MRSLILGKHPLTTELPKRQRTGSKRGSCMLSARDLAITAGSIGDARAAARHYLRLYRLTLAAMLLLALALFCLSPIVGAMLAGYHFTNEPSPACEHAAASYLNSALPYINARLALMREH